MSTRSLRPLTEALRPERFDTPPILKKLITANRKLAELKGVVASIPNQEILISTLGLQEAKESSAIENIVTTQDELFRDDSPHSPGTAAAKEVRLYATALRCGYEAVRQHGLLTSNHIIDIQSVLEPNRVGYRKVPGTTLRDGAGHVVYTPPSPELLPNLMGDLERFTNDNDLFSADPLVKMALVHHQFESIHPFYDGNGRTGRIINVLYLVKEKMLDIPVLYLSRAIVRTKADYYRTLQAVRDNDAWEDWVLYMLGAIEQTATESITTIQEIKRLLQEYKHRIRSKHKFYSQDLINNLFSFPYTKIDFIQNDLKVSRLTATRYLDVLAKDGLLLKRKIGRSNYYINPRLFRVLTGEDPPT
ncbi:MAG: toxin Fic [Rhodanobacteraceae bacterium]